MPKHKDSNHIKDGQSKNNTEKIILIVLVLILISSLVYYFQTVRPSNKSSRISTTQIVTTPIPPPIPHGKTDFSTSLNNDNAPKASQGYIDPYDPKVGETQKVAITLKDAKVKWAKVTLQTDNQKKTYDMKLAEGTDSNGVWLGEWKVDDTYFYTYLLTIEAEGSKATGKVVINLR